MHVVVSGEVAVGRGLSVDREIRHKVEEIGDKEARRRYSDAGRASIRESGLFLESRLISPEMLRTETAIVDSDFALVLKIDLNLILSLDTNYNHILSYKGPTHTKKLDEKRIILLRTLLNKKFTGRNFIRGKQQKPLIQLKAKGEEDSLLSIRKDKLEELPIYRIRRESSELLNNSTSIGDRTLEDRKSRSRDRSLSDKSIQEKETRRRELNHPLRIAYGENFNGQRSKLNQLYYNEFVKNIIASKKKAQVKDKLKSNSCANSREEHPSYEVFRRNELIRRTFANKFRSDSYSEHSSSTNQPQTNTERVIAKLKAVLQADDSNLHKSFDQSEVQLHTTSKPPYKVHNLKSSHQDLAGLPKPHLGTSNRPSISLSVNSTTAIPPQPSKLSSRTRFVKDFFIVNTLELCKEKGLRRD